MTNAKLPTPSRPTCGKPMERHGRAAKTVQSLRADQNQSDLLPLPRCGGFHPLDRALVLEDKNAASGAESIYAGSDSYKAANRKLRNLADVDVPKAALQHRSGRNGQEMREFKREDVEAEAPSVDRILVEIDGTGVPMLASDVEGVFRKQEDGTARIREAKTIVSSRQTAGTQRQGNLGRTEATGRAAPASTVRRQRTVSAEH